MKRSCKPSSRSPGKPAEKVDRDESRHEGNNIELRKFLLKSAPKKGKKVRFSITPRAFQPFIPLVCVYEVQAGYPGAVQSDLIL